MLGCWTCATTHLQIFSCKSGTYIIGSERAHSNNNNLVISKMEDDSGGYACARVRGCAGSCVCEGVQARMCASAYERQRAFFLQVATAAHVART
jgi:hypothetical protein